MKVTSQMVQELQKRIDVTYEEAERILLRTNGNLDRAEEILEKQENSGFSRLMDEVGRIYRELLTYYLKVTRNDKIIVDLPLIVVIGLYLIMTVDSKVWVGIVSIGIILISESTLTIHRVMKEDERIVKTGDQGPKSSTRVDEKAVDSDGPSKPVVEPGQATIKEEDDDDYYEITIEK